MPDSAASPLSISSIYHPKVDEKRRIQIPAKWRLGEAELMLIVWQNGEAGACLRVFPPATWAKFLANLDAMENSKKKISFKRLIGSKSASATLDKAGRICLPEDMACEAGITEEVTLVGMIDQFEIWNPQRHKSVAAMDDVLASEAFGML